MLVPTINNFPVVLPSHVDNDRTCPHYHIDRRYKVPNTAEWDDETIKRYNILPDDTLIPSIVKDKGEPIVWKEMERIADNPPIGGAVFSSLCWLYKNLGDRCATRGKCPHHGTQLNDHFVCPAHGMRFCSDGKPFYKSPFFLRIYGQNKTYHLIPLELSISIFNEKELNDVFVGLEDSNKEKISYMHVEKINIGITEITINAWPDDGFCPGFKNALQR